MFTGYEQKELQGLADAAKIVLEGYKSLEEIAATMSKEDASNFMGAAAAAKKAGKKEFEFGGKTYPVRISKDVADEIAEVDMASAQELSASAMGPEDEEDGVEGSAKVTDGIGEEAKPDFLDIDKDGDKEEPMAKAAKDKEQKECMSREDFKPHMMYDPKTGKGVMANTFDDHLRLDKMGYVHDKPTEKMDEALSFRDRMRAKSLVRQANTYYRNMDKVEKFAFKNSRDLSKVERSLGGMIADLKREFFDGSRYNQEIEKIVGGDAFFNFKEFADDAYEGMVSAEAAFEEHVRQLKDNDPDAQETLDIFLDRLESANRSYGEFLRSAVIALEDSIDEANEFEAPFAEDSEKLKEFAKAFEVPQFDTDQDAAEKLKNKHDIEITEGKMKELSGYIEAGLTAKEIAKVMKLKLDAAMLKFLKKMGAK